MKIRKAAPADAEEISAFLQALARLGKRRLPSDVDYVRTNYISHPDGILCSVAEDEDGTLLGLQILKVASIGNPYDVTPGWGIIGTHVNPAAARRGVGKQLFAATRVAAEKAGLAHIDATIGAANTEGQAYYAAMGFVTYIEDGPKLCKRFDL